MGSVIEKIRVAIGLGDVRAIDAALGDHTAFASLPIALLHDLLLMPGHNNHQRVAFEMQGRADPSSLPVVRQVLDQGFSRFAYTCSEDAVIAKWFSQILARIGTPEAVGMLGTYSASKNRGMAEEMQYRQKRFNEQERV